MSVAYNYREIPSVCPHNRLTGWLAGCYPLYVDSQVEHYRSNWVNSLAKSVVNCPQITKLLFKSTDPKWTVSQSSSILIPLLQQKLIWMDVPTNDDLSVHICRWIRLEGVIELGICVNAINYSYRYLANDILMIKTSPTLSYLPSTVHIISSALTHPH